jgi:hypothetical protein
MIGHLIQHRVEPPLYFLDAFFKWRGEVALVGNANFTEDFKLDAVL